MTSYKSHKNKLNKFFFKIDLSKGMEFGTFYLMSINEDDVNAY